MSDLAPFFALGLPVLTVLAVGLLGRTRQIGFWTALFLSILLTPVGGFLVTLLSGPKQWKPQTDRRASGYKP